MIAAFDSALENGFIERQRHGAGGGVAVFFEVVEDAVAVGVARACKTLKNVTSAWVQDQKVDVTDGKISCFRVILKVTFVLHD